MRLLIYHITLILFVSCSTKPGQRKDESALVPVDSLAGDSITVMGEEEPEDAYQLNYVVLVAEGYDYDSLRRTALEASALLHYRFDTLDRIYTRSTTQVVRREDSED